MKIEENNNKYNLILEKIDALRAQYPSLRNKGDEYCFSVLCLKNNFFKNPALSFDERVISESIVDGIKDGGIDILISEKDSENCNFALCQSKFYKDITFDDITGAIYKMISFYKDMSKGNYGIANSKVQKKIYWPKLWSKWWFKDYFCFLY